MSTPPVPSRVRSDFTKVLLKPVAWLMGSRDPHATLDRFFISRHLKDLRLIVTAALIAVVLVFVGGVVTRVRGQTLTGIVTFITPVLGVLGAVLTWAYQAGSARLGVVDLFACEISTLCRVAAIVNTVRRAVDRFMQGPRGEPSRSGGSHTPGAHAFTSQESYFPVFDSSVRDLQTLEARVVINITAFYTYMKAVRDSMRALAEIGPQPAEPNSAATDTPTAGSWHEAARNVVYMLFLGLESARHSIAHLVEFQPE